MTKKQLHTLKRKYGALRADDYYGCQPDDENEFVCKSNEADALVYAMIVCQRTMLASETPKRR